MSYINLKNVCKKYGKDNFLFKNISLNIEKGEFIGFVGKSGAGKTTLLNILGLITEINDGEINIGEHFKISSNGKDAMYLRRESIGYLFQNYGLIDDESVIWNLMLALEYKKMNKKEKMAAIELQLRKFELKDFANKKIFQLSGGEQQRIAIIRLILQGSQIILADEPTSGLDENNQTIVMNILRDLNKQGITIVMVTHNLNLCRYFTRVIDVEEFN